MQKALQSDVAYPKVNYPKSPIIQPWKFEMWLTKVDFLFAILNKTYDKNLRYLSLWVFDSIPCMNLVKTWVINTLHDPRVGPRVAPLSLVHSYIPTCFTLPCLLFSFLFLFFVFVCLFVCLFFGVLFCFCCTSMVYQRVYLLSCTGQQIALNSNRLPCTNSSFLQHVKKIDRHRPRCCTMWKWIYTRCNKYGIPRNISNQ